MYFRGIAIPKRTKKEIASNVLINLNDFTERSTAFIFLQRYMLQLVPLYFKFILWEDLFSELLLSLKEKIDAPTFTIAGRNNPKFITELL